jgi:small subunit ribosomal protein S16
MSVKIRLSRHGMKKKPFYRIVVSDSRYPRDGRFIEQLGTYDPRTHPAAILLDHEKLQGWIKQGAQPSQTVKDILKRAARAATGPEKTGESAQPEA